MKFKHNKLVSIQYHEDSIFAQNNCLRLTKNLFGEFNAWKIHDLLSCLTERPNQYMIDRLPQIVKDHPACIDNCFLYKNKVHYIEVKSARAELTYKQIEFFKKLVDLKYDCWLFHQRDPQTKPVTILLNKIINRGDIRMLIRQKVFPEDYKSNIKKEEYSNQDYLESLKKQISYNNQRIHSYKQSKKHNQLMLKKCKQILKKCPHFNLEKARDIAWWHKEIFVNKYYKEGDENI